MNRFSISAFVATLMFVGGCAMKGEMPTSATRAERSITVAVDAEDVLSLQHIGTTVFNNVYATQKIPDWKLANVVRVKAAAILRNERAFKAVVEDDGALGRAFTGVTSTMGTSFWKIGDVEKIVQANAAMCKTDVLVILRSHTSGDHLTGTNQMLRGHGIHQRGVLGLSNRATAFVNMNALVIDCVKKAEAGTSFANSVKEFPFEMVKENELQLPPDHLAVARETIEKLAETSSRMIFSNLSWIP